MVLEVSAPADDKTVEHAHRAALRQQAVDEVAADKTGAARHQVDSCRRCHHPSSVGRELMRSKATNFKHRWPGAKNRVTQGFCRRVFWGYSTHARVEEAATAAAQPLPSRHHDCIKSLAWPLRVFGAHLSMRLRKCSNSRRGRQSHSRPLIFRPTIPLRRS